MKKILITAVSAFCLAGMGAAALHADMDSPNYGKKVVLTGEVLDMDCFMNEGAHGADHQSCAVMCLNNGAPVGLLTPDGKAYFLTANEKKGMMKYYNNVRGWGGDTVKITGRLQKRAGIDSVRIDGAVKVK